MNVIDYMDKYIDSSRFERAEVREEAKRELSECDYSEFANMADVLDRFSQYRRELKHAKYIKRLLELQKELYCGHKVVNFRSSSEDVAEDTQKHINNLFDSEFDDDK